MATSKRSSTPIHWKLLKHMRNEKTNKCEIFNFTSKCWNLLSTTHPNHIGLKPSHDTNSYEHGFLCPNLYIGYRGTQQIIGDNENWISNKQFYVAMSAKTNSHSHSSHRLWGLSSNSWLKLGLNPHSHWQRAMSLLFSLAFCVLIINFQLGWVLSSHLTGNVGSTTHHKLLGLILGGDATFIGNECADPIQTGYGGEPHPLFLASISVLHISQEK